MSVPSRKLDEGEVSERGMAPKGWGWSLEGSLVALELPDMIIIWCSIDSSNELRQLITFIRFTAQLTTTQTEGPFLLFLFSVVKNLLTWLWIGATTLDLSSYSGAFDL